MELKDWLNFATSTVAVGVALYSVLRQRNLERRVAWEQIFQHQWKRIHPEIEKYIDDIDSYAKLAAKDSGDLSNDPEKLSIGPAPDIDRLDWRFERKTERLLNNLFRDAAHLHRSREEWWRLRWLTGTGRLLALEIREVGLAEFDDPDWIGPLVKKYTDSEHPKFSDVGESERYQRDLAETRKEVNSTLLVVQKALPNALKKVEHFKARYTD